MSGQALRDAAILETLGLSPRRPLGEGGEAVVYAMDDDRVARIYHPGHPPATVHARTRLLAELEPQALRVPFAIPRVLETRDLNGRLVTLEPRLEGRPVEVVLGELRGAAREALVRAYLEAAHAIGALDVERPGCGDLCRDDPLHAPSPRDYHRLRAVRNLRAAGPEFSHVDARALAEALPSSEQPALVHLDAFPGNMLTDGRRVTAVLDFGTVSIRGEPRIDPLLAAVYLQRPMSRTATARDRQVAQDWLAEHGLAEPFRAAERWCAVFWLPASDDAALHRWCRSLLRDGDTPG